MSALEQNTKVGKRVRRDRIDTIEEIIQKLQDAIAGLLGFQRWGNYKEEEKQGKITRGSVERVARARQPVAESGAGAANWTAKVGESIIGNLARGEGGRFVSASNIRSMMGMLDRSNISPNMFNGMQELLAGNEIDAQTLKQLQTAGLANEQGMTTGKGNDIIQAIGTGEPDNLKAIVKPKAKGKAGRGKKPKKPPKPTKAEQEQANTDKTSKEIVANDRMTNEQIDAFNKFVKGEDVSKEALEDLQDLGLLEINSEGFFALNRFGKRLDRALEKGELRDAMDVLSQAKEARKSQLKEEADNVEKTSAKIVEQGALTQQQMDAFLQLVEGVELSQEDKIALTETNLAGQLADFDMFFKDDGNEFIKALQIGNLDDALDILEFEEADIEEQNITDTSTRLVEDNRISKNEIAAFNRFIANEDLSAKEIEILQDLNLLELNEANQPILNSAARSLRSALKRGDFLRAAEIIAQAQIKEKELSAFKMLGNNYFVTWTTNAYKDREAEIFTLKSIEDYVQSNLNDDMKGEYDYWHIPGSEFANVIEQFVVGKFLVEIGQFKDSVVGNGFKELFMKYPDGNPDFAPHGWGCSHGYVYHKQDREDLVYEWFDKDKSTILPLEEAANIYTTAEFFGEKSMTITDKQKMNVERIGIEIGIPDLLQKILNAGQKRTKVLDEQGIESKQAVVKTEADFEYPARCYAYVPDKEKPSTWKLRMCAVETTEITREQLGAAAAAFSPGGHRGKKVKLPQEDVAKTKRRIRSEYTKLDVKKEDMPASIKSLEDSDMNEFLKQLAEASKSMHTEELKTQMDELLARMEKEDEDRVGILRQMLEVVAQIDDAELRGRLEELVSAMLPQEETELEEEMEIAEEQEVVEEEEKSTDNGSIEIDEEKVVAQLVKAVHEEIQLDKLSEMLESHTKSIEIIPQLQTAIQELVEKVKHLADFNERLHNTVKELQVSDEQKIAEKQARFTPFWSSHRASQAAETVLSQEEEKNFAKPKMPSFTEKVNRAILGD